MDRIDKAIDNDLGIFNDSRDKINIAKEEYNKLLEKAKKEKKNCFETIVNENNLSPEQIAVLFYKFRLQELTKEGEEPPQIDGRHLSMTRDHGIARTIYDYMCEHPEQFGEYLTEKGFVSGSKINETFLNYEFSNVDKQTIGSTFDIVESKLNHIEERKKNTWELRQELDEKLDSLVGIAKEDISEEDKAYLFSTAEMLQRQGALTGHLKRHLIRIDTERLRQAVSASKDEFQYEELQVAVIDTISSFGKKVTGLPKKLFKREEENKEGENKTSSNKRKGFFSKIFKKDKTELLPEGSDVQKEENNSEHGNKNQQAFDINEKHHVDHFKAMQETEEAKKVKESRQEELDESESDRNV